MSFLLMSSENVRQGTARVPCVHGVRRCRRDPDGCIAAPSAVPRRNTRGARHEPDPMNVNPLLFMAGSA